MKKIVTMVMTMVMVLMMVLVSTGMGEEESRDYKPTLHVNDLERLSFGDGVDYQIIMFARTPEYDHVRVEISVKFTGDEWNNYNEGTLSFYDTESGELLDSATGSLIGELNCASGDANAVQTALLNYLNEYNFEEDYKNGTEIYSIWF